MAVGKSCACRAIVLSAKGEAIGKSEYEEKSPYAYSGWRAMVR